jgi:Holliday junction DNA helicase RuvA
MITRITGILNRVLEEEVRLQVGALEYQVLVPECVRRSVQTSVGKELTFHTIHYLDGNPMQGRVVPRLIGFSSEVELDFFELFCTVDKVGTRKALKALVRPVKEVADAIQRQDSKWLSTLPGVGGPTAEKIIATLRRKVTRFALMPAASGAPGEGGGAGAAPPPSATVAGNVLEDVYQALLSIGHTPTDARSRLDKLLATGRTFQSVEEALLEIYKSSP